MSAVLQGVHHISLRAKGLENFGELQDFYCGVLGCGVIRTWGEGEEQGVMLDLGNTVLEIFASGGEQLQTGLFTHFAFRTDDLDEIVARVRAAGRPISMEPAQVNLSGYLARVAFCIGPAGEEIEFFQER